MSLIFMLLLSSKAFACYTPPVSYVSPYIELIARTSKIALVKIESVRAMKAAPSSKRQFVIYSASIRQMIKGQLPNKVEIMGLRSVEGNPDTTFMDHSDDKFWDNHGGRTINSYDCKIYPNFIVGRRYLIFFDKPYHFKSFERIDSLTDRWLTTVIKFVKNHP